MNISIKNMVCSRCSMVVSNIFHEAGIQNANVQLGKVVTIDPIPVKKLELINIQLKEVGFEIINDHMSQLIEQVKNISIDLVYNRKEDIKVNFSDYLADKLNLDDNYISTLFSSIEGTTIEKYMINLKIEHVKELLVYDEKTLSEIAFEMGYSSVAHLSSQFKKVTGFTPSHFKEIGDSKRKTIDEIR
jgi:AraC family transcriptional regulator